ncbi:MAG: EAL domain-containing protein [Sterolibacterium sp.]
MMNGGIRERVLFLALAPLVIVALLLAIYFTNSRIVDLNQSLHERGLAIARQLAPASEYGVFSGNREVLQGLVNAARQEADVKGVSILDTRNNILATSGHPLSAIQESAISSSAGDIVEGEESLIFSAPIYQSEVILDDFSLSAAPTTEKAIGADRRLLGRVNVELGRTQTIARRNQLLLNSLLITLLGLVGSALLALRLSRQVIHPITSLADAVDKLGRGNLDVAVETHSRGEMATLEQGFNAMAATIKLSQGDLLAKIQEATAKLAYQSCHDTLTGLPNRREFEVRLGHALAGAKRNAQAHGLCYVDLDHFRMINDACGHQAGDELLRRLTLLMQNALSAPDVLARLDGDEFGVLLENCPLEKAQEVAEALCQTVRSFRFIWEDQVFMVGASIGLVSVDPETVSVTELLSAAESACCAAKDNGRNRVQVFHREDIELVRRSEELQWVTRIAHALEKDRFLLHYQKISPIDPARNSEAHFEFLLRMLDENGNIIMPMTFIPAAERYSLMPSIDRWVIGNAFKLCHQSADNCSTSSRIIFTINLSASSLCDEHFPEFVQEQFTLYGVRPETICFEIAETVAIAHLGNAIALMKALKKTGCLFSLDDFGSGLSSFSCLKNLPVDYLKIDGAFVRDMATDPVYFAMVEAINKIGQAMELKTIAEFVESEVVLKRLGEIGVDYVQGYLIDPPKPIADIFQRNRKNDSTAANIARRAIPSRSCASAPSPATNGGESTT